jgi:hypothetical protein
VKSLPFAEESGGLEGEEEEEQHDVDDDKHLLLLVVTTQIWKRGVRVFQKYLLRNKETGKEI